MISKYLKFTNILIFLLFFFFHPNRAFALDCKNIEGYIKDNKGAPIAEAYIDIYIGGQKQNNEFINTDQTGLFIWVFDTKGDIYIKATAPDYEPKQELLTSCSNFTITLIKKTDIISPLPNQISCNSPCNANNPHSCDSAINGCTKCKTISYSDTGTCQQPEAALPVREITGCDPCMWCQGMKKPDNYQECINCLDSAKNANAPKFDLTSKKSWTALGCIDTSPEGFVSWFLTGAIGIGGGVAFLIMLWGVFTMITSAGNPERLNQGREIIVSAIAGLIMIIFSVFLLKVIGVDILKIPGFG